MQRKIRITYNAPVTLTFILICGAVTLLGYVTSGRSTATLFAVYGLQLNDPLTYMRLFTHVLGHADLSHFLNNDMYLLILGPMLEEKYGSKAMIQMIVSTAFVTGLLHALFFGNTGLLGASGIVFACIMMASFTAFRQGEIPLTFVLVLVLYLGTEIYNGLAVSDNISNLTHIIGGLCGSVIGYSLNRNRKL